MELNHPLPNDVLSGQRSFQDLVRYLLCEHRRTNSAVFRSPHEGLSYIIEKYRKIEAEVFEAKDKKSNLIALASLAAMCQRFAEDVMHTKPESR
jgi:hypothetical protein